MWFKQTSCVVGRRVKSKCDCFGVLQGCVEGVVKVHKECIAAPPETVFDIRVGEPCMVEEICSHYLERVCPPTCSIGVFGREVVYRNGNRLEPLVAFGSHDVRETTWVGRVSPDGKMVKWWESEAESLLEYA